MPEKQATDLRATASLLPDAPQPSPLVRATAPRAGTGQAPLRRGLLVWGLGLAVLALVAWPALASSGPPRLTADGTRLLAATGQTLARLQPAGAALRVVGPTGVLLGHVRPVGVAWRVEDARRARVGALTAAYLDGRQGCRARWSLTDASGQRVAMVDEAGRVRDARGRSLGTLRARVPGAVGMLLLARRDEARQGDLGAQSSGNSRRR